MGLSFGTPPSSEEPWEVQQLGSYTVVIPYGSEETLRIEAVNVGRESVFDSLRTGTPVAGEIIRKSFAGRDAYQYTCDRCLENQYSRAIIIIDLISTRWQENNEIWYDIYFSPELSKEGREYQNNLIATYDQILSTFRFLE